MMKFVSYYPISRYALVCAVAMSAFVRCFVIFDTNTYCGRRRLQTKVPVIVRDVHNNNPSESDSFVVRNFNAIEDLENIIKLASRPIPERPDGIVVVAKYSAINRNECRATEADYERFARRNPATLFLRCWEEDGNAHLLLQQVDIRTWPTIDVFYQGNRVARLEGTVMQDLEKVLNMYQLMNSDLDLFSEDANQKREVQWGEGKDMTKTPKTTNRFVPAYDWNTNQGFFDEQGNKAQQSFEDTFGNWLPNQESEE